MLRQKAFEKTRGGEQYSDFLLLKNRNEISFRPLYPGKTTDGKTVWLCPFTAFETLYNVYIGTRYNLQGGDGGFII